MCVSHPWLCRLYSHDPTGVSLSSVEVDPANRPLIAVKHGNAIFTPGLALLAKWTTSVISLTLLFSPFLYHLIFHQPRVPNGKVINRRKILRQGYVFIILQRLFQKYLYWPVCRLYRSKPHAVIICSLTTTLLLKVFLLLVIILFENSVCS